MSTTVRDRVKLYKTYLRMVFVGSVQVILIVAVVALLDAFSTLVFRQIKRQFSRWKMHSCRHNWDKKRKKCINHDVLIEWQKMTGHYMCCLLSYPHAKLIKRIASAVLRVNITKPPNSKVKTHLTASLPQLGPARQPSTLSSF